jgi:hypothetical protein
LCDDETVKSAGTRAVCEDSSSLGELGNPSDTSVFLIQLCRDNLVFGGSYGRENVGFALVVTVCANT